MAVFRIEKNSDFTIMPNYPFRDMRLSFKGRGLLGTMLTLRDDWDYTLAGLTAISPHGKSYVSTGLNELEQLGYLERRQLRDEQGVANARSEGMVAPLAILAVTFIALLITPSILNLLSY